MVKEIGTKSTISFILPFDHVPSKLWIRIRWYQENLVAGANKLIDKRFAQSRNLNCFRPIVSLDLNLRTLNFICNSQKFQHFVGKKRSACFLKHDRCWSENFFFVIFFEHFSCFAVHNNTFLRYPVLAWACASPLIQVNVCVHYSTYYNIFQTFCWHIINIRV